MTEISVIIPHYNDVAGLKRCVQALLDQDGLETIPFEIVVGDNGSDIGIGVLSRLLGDRVRVVHAAERGAGPARNCAVAHSSGRMLAFIDSDCVPDRSWLIQGYRQVLAHQFVGGQMRVDLEQRDRLSGAEAFEAIFAFDNRRYIEKLGFSVTANLMCSRAMFDDVGPFRNGVAEDKEWCHRARAAGYIINYAENALVDHPPRPDWPSLKKKWQRLNREAYCLARERGMSKLSWLARAILLPFSVIPHTVKCLSSPKVKSPRNRILAIGTLIKLRLWRFIDCLFLATGPDHRSCDTSGRKLL